MNNPYPLILTPQQWAQNRPDNALLLDLSPPAQYEDEHIEGAVLFASAHLRTNTPPAMGMVPSTQSLKAALEAAGVGAHTHVVACDSTSGRDACRLLWTLNLLGIKQCSWLCGERPAWRAAGIPLHSGVSPAASLTAFPDVPERPELHTDCAQILDALNSERSLQVWDCRTWDEFTGEEQRAQRSGHIPGAFHLEWIRLLDDCGTPLPAEEVRQLLDAAGCDLSEPVVVHCQLHARSSVAWVIAHNAGLNISAYAGSWAEWGNLEHVPIEDGAGRYA